MRKIYVVITPILNAHAVMYIYIYIMVYTHLGRIHM